MYRTSSIVVHLALFSATATAAPGEAPARLVESPLSSANLIDTAIGLFAVLGILLLLAWLVKRFVQVPGINKGQVRVLGGVSLGAREKAVLLTVDGRRLLVGVAPGRVQTLLVLGEDVAVETGGETGGEGFAAELQHATQRPVGTEAPL